MRSLTVKASEISGTCKAAVYCSGEPAAVMHANERAAALVRSIVKVSPSTLMRLLFMVIRTTDVQGAPCVEQRISSSLQPSRRHLRCLMGLEMMMNLAAHGCAIDGTKSNSFLDRVG